MMSERAAFECRGWTVDERTVAGIAVPYGETSYVTPSGAGGERFIPGSLSRSARGKRDRLKLFRGHDLSVAIGRAEKVDVSHEAGLWFEWRIFNTPKGDEALLEIAEGALDTFSIGFRAIRTRRAQDGAREILEAEIHETSLVPLGAYEGARVLAVRGYGAADITKWLDEHRMPPVVASFPELARYSRR